MVSPSSQHNSVSLANFRHSKWFSIDSGHFERLLASSSKPPDNESSSKCVQQPHLASLFLLNQSRDYWRILHSVRSKLQFSLWSKRYHKYLIWLFAHEFPSLPSILIITQFPESKSEQYWRFEEFCIRKTNVKSPFDHKSSQILLKIWTRSPILFQTEAFSITENPMEKINVNLSFSWIPQAPLSIGSRI